MLTYNGVTMRIERSAVEQRAWYSADGKDLLGTHIIIRTQCVWSPFATNSNATVGITSVAALRQTLMTPRKQLVFSVPSGGSAGSSILLRSPYNIPAGYTGAGTPFRRDSNNGPCPIACDITEIQGERNCFVTYAIETWLTECPTIHAILSHRWEMAHTIDRDYFTTRIIRGTAVFRGEWIDFRNQATNATYELAADLQRMNLFPPIPGNFKREVPYVGVAADGLTVNYEIHDVEQPSNIDIKWRRRITRVEATYSESEGVVSVDPGAYFNALGSAAEAIASGGTSGVGNALSSATNVARVFYPMIGVQLDIQVWGRRTATKDDLINALMTAVTTFGFAGGASILDGIILGAIGTTSRALFNTSFFAIDLVNATAKYQGRAEFPTVVTSALRLMGLMPGTTAVRAGGFPNNIKGLTTWNDGGTLGPGADNNSRSTTYLAKAVTAALKEPCSPTLTPSY